MLDRFRDWWTNPFLEVARESFGWLEQDGFTVAERRMGHAELLEYEKKGEKILVMAEAAASGGQWVAVQRDGDTGYIAQATVPRRRESYIAELSRLSGELRKALHA